MWQEAEIIELSPDKNLLKVHINGAPSNYYEWVFNDSPKIQFFRSKTVQNENSPFLSPFPSR